MTKGRMEGKENEENEREPNGKKSWSKSGSGIEKREWNMENCLMIQTSRCGLF